ncbi:MAG: NAD(P)/FAD-dependent oxidoreductase [Planctomycetes bacterium]|nr:NAD(P)/FAD-dependent oxidoreductase [Planctomycetota bacterium]
MSKEFDVVVIGAGAAGLLAAARAAQRGRRVVLLEKNNKPGVKILMSGGTRCNLTHATDRRGIVDAFGRQGPFLHSALAALGPDEVISLFASAGVATKIEATGKVFPVSNRAVDVLEALRQILSQSGTELRLGTPVRNLVADEKGFCVQTDRTEILAKVVILTTGGKSYPGCGTTGDGYIWAKQFGHKIVPPRPALVPLRSECRWVNQLSGVTLPDVQVRIVAGESKKPAGERRGSFLFTHFGLSGPAVMDVSREITARPDADDWRAVCDFLPARHQEEIIVQLEDAARTTGKSPLATVVSQWLPRRMVEALLAEAKLNARCPVAELSKTNRHRLLDALKRQPIPLAGSLGFKKAEVTAGGVALREIDSSTMQSKLAPNLFLAGEILDLDGPIGGYNFQAAFSTGWLAGESV